MVVKLYAWVSKCLRSGQGASMEVEAASIDGFMGHNFTFGWCEAESMRLRVAREDVQALDTSIDLVVNRCWMGDPRV